MKWIVVPSHLRKVLKDAPFKMDMGWGNGYVLIPSDHPWYEMDYELIPVNVHGGLTFGQTIDRSYLDVFPLDENDIGKYMIGFDTGHYRDTLEFWPKKRVIQETLSLEKQIRNLGEAIFID